MEKATLSFEIECGLWKPTTDKNITVEDIAEFYQITNLRRDPQKFFSKCIADGFISISIVDVEYFNNFQKFFGGADNGTKAVMIIEREKNSKPLFNFLGFLQEEKIEKKFLKFQELYDLWKKESEEKRKSSSITPVTFHLDLDFGSVDKMDEKKNFWFYFRVFFLHQFSNFTRHLLKKYSLQNNDYPFLVTLWTSDESRQLKDMIINVYFDGYKMANNNFLTDEEFKKELDNSSYKHCIMMLAVDFIETKKEKYFSWWIYIEEVFMFFRLHFFHELCEMVLIGQTQNCNFTKYISDKIDATHLEPLKAMYGIEKFHKTPQFWVKLPIFEYPVLLEKRIGVLRESQVCVTLCDLRDWIIPSDYSRCNRANFWDLVSKLENLLTEQKLDLNLGLELYADARDLLREFFVYKEAKINPEVLPDIEDLCKNYTTMPLCQRLHAKNLLEEGGRQHLNINERLDFRSFLLDIGFNTDKIKEHWKKHQKSASESKMRKYLSNVDSNLTDTRVKNCQKRIEGSGCPFNDLKFEEIQKHVFIRKDEDLFELQKLIESSQYREACAFDYSTILNFQNREQVKPFYNPTSFTRAMLQNSHRMK